MEGLIFTLFSFGLLIGCQSFSPDNGRIEPWQGKFWQGDINLTPDQKAILASSSQASSTDQLLVQRWPKGYGNFVKIPVMFDHFGNFSKTQRNFVWSELRTLEEKTCIRFIERVKHVNFIRIVNGNGCYSRLGKIGGMQDISLENPECLQKGTPIHEFMHALGYDHMHNRFDRDQFVTVHLENVPKDKKSQSQFDKVDPRFFGNISTSYDYFSVMHFGRNAGSINQDLDVLVPTDSSFIDIIGQQQTISEGDIERINIMYECPL